MDTSYSESWTPARKGLVAAAVVIGLLVIVGGFYGYQRYQQGKLPPGVERIEELGFGYRRVTIAKLNKGQMAHYPFFYYQRRMLCQIIGTQPSISPSGNFAVYQDINSGKLMLFHRTDEKSTPITAGSMGLVRGFTWHEAEGTVEAELGGMSAVLPLK